MTTEELEIWKKLNELPEVKKAKSSTYEGDRMCYLCVDNTIYQYMIIRNNQEVASYDIWLPPLYDPIRPERSLWGMVDWRD